MIDFSNFEMTDGKPIYLQIILHIKRGIVAGTVEDGDALPSRRTLSALLGVNPNTIQKAYAILEEEELIQSRPGAKSFVAVDREKQNRVAKEMISEDIKVITESLKQMGVTKDEAIELIRTFWE